MARRWPASLLIAAAPCTAPATCTYERDSDYCGGDYTSVGAKDQGDCCYRCSIDNQCVIGVYYEGICYMKAAGATKCASPGRVACKPQSTPPSGCTQLTNTDLGGPNIGKDEGNGTAATCCAGCLNLPGCAGVVLFQSSCYYKGYLQESPFDGRIALVPGTAPQPPPTPPSPTPPPGPHDVCLHNPSATTDALQNAINYACGDGGVDCAKVNSGGACYDPNTLTAHADWVFDTYYQKNKPSGGTCDFGGAAKGSTCNVPSTECVPCPP